MQGKSPLANSKISTIKVRYDIIDILKNSKGLKMKNDNLAPNFIKNIIIDDLESKKHTNIITRFPPEPNGYLHVGHAKAICINFGLAHEFNGKCNLRFDDTNPEKESDEYARSIERDIRWLGFNWDSHVRNASDYFDKLFECAVFFIKNSLAYVCELTNDEMKEYRGSFTQKGKNSPYRSRSVEENLELFYAMRDGKFPDGSKTLRLKIDMESPNMNMRDPVIYRIKRAHHIKTHDKWCIYPMYDYTHCISDAMESITHSCCSLEFEDHRPLYDFVVDHLFKANMIPAKPRQIEFSRLELQYTVTSKRKLNSLVVKSLVSGWDDPRMPTISGMRNRGYTPDGIKLFAKRLGVSKAPNIVDLSILEQSIREDLENKVPRIMAVLTPIKVVLTNYDSEIGSRVANFHPNIESLGSRTVSLTREIYIEQDDFMEVGSNGFMRLVLGGEVRLRHSYIIKCDEVIKNADGSIKELLCSIDKNTLGKNPEGRKVKGVIHWVNISDAIEVDVNLYDRLFTHESPDAVEGHDFTEFMNKESLKVVKAYVEPAVKELIANNNITANVNILPIDLECPITDDINELKIKRFQFERVGYFIFNKKSSTKSKLVFNKTVGLKDTWKKG